MKVFINRKVVAPKVKGVAGDNVAINLDERINPIEARVSSLEDERDSDDTDSLVRDSRLTALETKMDDQLGDIQDFIDAYNAHQANKTITPRTNTVSLTLAAVASGVTRTRSLYPLTNEHATGDGWSIEFRHSTYTSGNWTTGNISVPQGTTVEVRAVETGTNTLLTSSGIPGLLNWTGALSGTTNPANVVMPAAGTAIGANVSTTTGEELIYSVTGDQESGAWTTGRFQGKVTVTVSGWVNTAGGSGAPVFDAFYQLSNWYSFNHGGDTSSAASYKASTKNGKLQVSYGDYGSTDQSDWVYPLGDGAANGDDGYPAINWSPNTAPLTLSAQDTLLGANAEARNMPQEGYNEYTFTIDVASIPGNSDSTSIRLGFRAWANSNSAGDYGDNYNENASRFGTFWVKAEPAVDSNGNALGSYSRT